MVKIGEPGNYLNEDEYVLAVGPNRIIYMQILTREPARFKTGDESGTAIFASVATTVAGGFQTLSQMEPNKRANHLYQVWWGVRTGGRYAIKVPTGSSRLGIDGQLDVAYLTNEESPYHSPNPRYEFWLINGYAPGIQFTNNTPVSITPQVYFRIMKYEYREITDEATKIRIDNKQLPSTKITLGGLITLS